MGQLLNSLVTINLCGRSGFFDIHTAMLFLTFILESFYCDNKKSFIKITSILKNKTMLYQFLASTVILKFQ